MIYFDVTRSGRPGHRSGLNRVSLRLSEELGKRATCVRWENGAWWAGRVPVAWTEADWLVTAELVTEAERPGMGTFLAKQGGRTAVIYHDAIPLKRPDITWARSVARHPCYMKELARFGQVWPVSRASQRELSDYWRWLGVESEVGAPLALGADFLPRAACAPSVSGRRGMLMVGILEPRKNQAWVLEVCESLWQEGWREPLVLIGRLNPEFGGGVARRIKQCQRRGYPVEWRRGVDDAGLQAAYREARIHLFATVAEGCGLPLLEAMGQGLPSLCSDLAVLRENEAGGGCEFLPLGDLPQWREALRRATADDDWWAARAEEIRGRNLPTWRAAADEIARRCGGE